MQRGSPSEKPIAATDGLSGRRNNSRGLRTGHGKLHAEAELGGLIEVVCPGEFANRVLVERLAVEVVLVPVNEDAELKTPIAQVIVANDGVALEAQDADQGQRSSSDSAVGFQV